MEKTGKPFKTRDGGVMRLSELLELTKQTALKKMDNKDMTEVELDKTAEIIADAAIKYADAISNRTTDYVFDVDKFTDNTGKTGPYTLYTVVRINSLLNKAKEQGLEEGKLLVPEENSDEQNVMLEIEKLPDVVNDAFCGKSLSEIVNYLYSLNSAYNNFYNNNKILTEENKEKQASMLKLSRIVGDINKKLLYIMAIKIPDRM